MHFGCPKAEFYMYYQSEEGGHEDHTLVWPNLNIMPLGTIESS